MAFAKKLQYVMDDLNLKQVDVVNLTGKSKSTISQYIAGKVLPPEKVQKEIAVALNLPEDYFVENVVKVLKSDRFVIPQISAGDVAKLMRLDVVTVQKGLQQKIFEWGYAIKTSSKWRYFINAKRFAEVEQIELPTDVIF